MNKRALANLYLFLLGVVGLLIVLIWLYAGAENVTKQEGFVVAKSAFEAAHGLQDRENALLFFDVGSRHAAYDAVDALMRNGGWFDTPACQEFGTVRLWYNDGRTCFPTRQSLSEQLAKTMQHEYFTRQLAKNPFLQGKKSARDYVYYGDIGTESVAVEGYAVRPFLLVVRCKSQVPDVDWGFGAGTLLGIISSKEERQSTFACGQIAIRPDFRHEINVPVAAMMDLEIRLRAMIEQCKVDADPASCMEVATEQVREEFNVEISRQAAGTSNEHAVALFTVPSGVVVPGKNAELVTRFGIRLRKPASSIA